MNYGPGPAGLAELEGVFSNFLTAIVGFAFVFLVIFLVWAGFKYLMSGGDPKGIAAARDTLTWALLGILFMIIAWLILQLIEAFTGAKVTVFDLRKLCGGMNGTQFCSPAPVSSP